MPDLLTHVSLTALVGRVRGDVVDAVLFSIGCVLPDLVGRPLLLTELPAFFNLPSHSIVMQPLYAWAAGRLLAPPYRARGTRLLLGGACFHLACDALQSHFGYVFGYYFLFPFSLWRTGAGFFHPSESVCAAPWILLAALAVWWPRRSRRARATG